LFGQKNNSSLDWFTKPILLSSYSAFRSRFFLLRYAHKKKSSLKSAAGMNTRMSSDYKNF
jgi:hypothetical protein